MKGYKVGVFGGIASGKSTLINYLKSLGVNTLSADEENKNLWLDPKYVDFLSSLFPEAVIKENLATNEKIHDEYLGNDNEQSEISPEFSIDKNTVGSNSRSVIAEGDIFLHVDNNEGNSYEEKESINESTSEVKNTKATNIREVINGKGDRIFIDKSIIKEIIFADGLRKERLEKEAHERIKKALIDKTSDGLWFIEVSVYVKNYIDFDEIWEVVTPLQERVYRLLSRDAISESLARSIIKQQPIVDEPDKIQILNNGDLSLFLSRIEDRYKQTLLNYEKKDR